MMWQFGLQAFFPPFFPKDMALMTFLSPCPEGHVQQFPSRGFQMSKGFDGQSVLHEGNRCQTTFHSDHLLSSKNKVGLLNPKSLLIFFYKL